MHLKKMDTAEKRSNKINSLHLTIIMLWILLFINSNVLANEVTGLVVNTNHNPVTYLNVMIYNENDELIAIDQTNSQGEFALDINLETTSIHNFDSSNQPNSFLLGSSYPNPFNPKTTFPVFAPKDDNLRISVYNILGQIVTSYQTQISKGSHEINVDLGGGLSQGTYLLNVKGDGFSETGLMTFISVGNSSGNTSITLEKSEKNPIEISSSIDISSSINETGAPRRYRIKIEETETYQTKEIFVQSNVLEVGKITVSFHDPSPLPTNRPNTIINQTEMEIVKQRIADGLEPQTSAFNQLLSRADNALDFKANPPSEMNIMGGFEPNSNLSEVRSWLWANCHAAYSTALAYGYTQNSEYADKAVEILNDWAEMGTEFTGADRGLQLGSWFTPMLYAADLVWEYEGWDEPDRLNFETWWRDNILVHTRQVMKERDNNWKDAGILGVITAGAVFKDRELIEEAILETESYFVTRRVGVRNPGPDWKIRKTPDGLVFLPREVVRNDGKSGITYTAYALTTMSQAFEIARYHGVDLWHRKTEQGAGMDELIYQFFRWEILNDSFPWHDSPSTRTFQRRNTYEIANNHFDIAWFRSYLGNIRPVNGEQGDEYSTLNKGDIIPQN